MKLILALVVCLVVVGCRARTDGDETKITDGGPIDFPIEKVDLTLYHEFHGIDGEEYYAHAGSLRNGAELELILSPRERSQRCSITKTLSVVERESFAWNVRTLRLCNYELPPNYPLPMLLAIPSGQIEGGGRVVKVSAAYVSGLAFCSSSHVGEFAHRFIELAKSDPINCTP